MPRSRGGESESSRTRMRSVVTERGQVTIPKPLRDQLGIEPGQVLEFEEKAGKLMARKVTPQAEIDSVYGVLQLGGSTDEAIEGLRGIANP